MGAHKNLTAVVTRAEAATMLGVGIRTADDILRRAGIRAGYPRTDVEWARDNRPGQGARTDLKPAATVVLHGYDGGAPTRRLTDALAAVAPDLSGPHDVNRAVLMVIPRRIDMIDDERPATAEAMYDLHWAHETVVEEECWGTETTYPKIVLRPFQHVGTLPHAPQIPVADRLAALPEPTLDGWSDAQITLIGGREAALAHVRAQQRIGVREDRTVDAYDWVALARTAVATVRALGQPPKLTAGQRAQVTAAALLTARARLAAAEQSLAAHLRNAADAGETVNLPAGVLA